MWVGFFLQFIGSEMFKESVKFSTITVAESIVWFCLIFSKTELKHALTKCGTYKFTNKQIEKMMEKVDSDKDGRVCYEGKWTYVNNMNLFSK